MAASRLNYKHLYYFWTVVNEGGVRRASERLHVTPQTISGQLALLEQSAGTPLLVKSGRGLVASDAGRQVYDYADEIFSRGAELEALFRSRSLGRPRQFSVGISDVVPKLIAYRLLEPALRLSEPMHVVCHENKPDRLLADIAVHRLDLVLTDSPLRPDVNVRAFNHLLGDCGVTFFAAPALAGRLRRGFPASLRGAPLLLPATGAAVRGALLRWFDEIDVSPDVVAEFDDSALIKAFGQAGIGAFAAPTAIAGEVVRQYQVKAFGSTERVRERFYAISAERRLTHPAVRAVSEAARAELFA